MTKPEHTARRGGLGILAPGWRVERQRSAETQKYYCNILLRFVTFGGKREGKEKGGEEQGRQTASQYTTSRTSLAV